jgi:hypothetical protein
MNPLRSQIVCLVAATLLASGARGEADLSALETGAASPDPAVRAPALLSLGQSLGTQAGWAQAATILPLAAKNLNDGDLGVRRAALSTLLRAAYRTTPVLNPGTPTAAFFSDPNVQAALLKDTSDPDAPTRQGAFEVYALAYKLTPDVENAVIAEFQAPDTRVPGQVAVKPALLGLLMIGGAPSPTAATFLTQMIDDPKYGDVVIEQIRSDHCPLPGPALTKLASKLASEPDATRRARLAGAIGAYGKGAAPVLPQLNAALASETDGLAKSEIQNSINKAQ